MCGVKWMSNQKQSNFKQQRQTNLDLSGKQQHKHNQSNEDKNEWRKQHTNICLPSSDKISYIWVRESIMKCAIQIRYKKLAYKLTKNIS